MGARESLNRRENIARRKEENGEKSPCGQCLTRPVPNSRRRSAFWLGRKTQKFSGTNQKAERRQPFGTGLVRHCLQGLFSPFFIFLRAIFFRPFRLPLAPTICPWVSEDDLFTFGRPSVWYKSKCDAPFSRSAPRSFAPLEKSRRHNRSCVWTGALSGMIFMAAPKLSGIVWPKPKRVAVLDLSHRQPNNFFQIIGINKPIRSPFLEENGEITA